MSEHKITALSSVIADCDGAEKDFDKLTENERKKLKAVLSDNISSAMSAYFTEHVSEWEDFIRSIKEDFINK